MYIIVREVTNYTNEQLLRSLQRRVALFQFRCSPSLSLDLIIALESWAFSRVKLEKQAACNIAAVYSPKLTLTRPDERNTRRTLDKVPFYYFTMFDRRLFRDLSILELSDTSTARTAHK